MKRIRIVLLSFCLAVLSTALAQRVLIDANENWKFNYYPKKDPAIKANVPYFAQLNFEENKWKSIAVPHTWSTFETTGELHPFIKSPGIKDNPYWWEGIGVYRKIFTVNNSNKGKKFFVEFDGVQKNCRVYINSKYIGQHFGGYSGFYFDLTDYILYDGQKNILCVEVSNLQDDPAIYRRNSKPIHIGIT